MCIRDRLSKGPLPSVYFCLELNRNRGYLEDKGVQKKNITEVSRLLSRHLFTVVLSFDVFVGTGVAFFFRSFLSLCPPKSI